MAAFALSAALLITSCKDKKETVIPNIVPDSLNNTVWVGMTTSKTWTMEFGNSYCSLIATNVNTQKTDDYGFFDYVFTKYTDQQGTISINPKENMSGSTSIPLSGWVTSSSDGVCMKLGNADEFFNDIIFYRTK